MTDVSCRFVVAIDPPPNQTHGQITLQDCNPAIANSETLSSWDVIWIVAILVALGLVGQFILHHVNRKALSEMKTAASHIIKTEAS